MKNTMKVESVKEGKARKVVLYLNVAGQEASLEALVSSEAADKLAELFSVLGALEVSLSEIECSRLACGELTELVSSQGLCVTCFSENDPAEEDQAYVEHCNREYEERTPVCSCSNAVDPSCEVH